MTNRNCKNCKNYKITKNGGEICRLRPKTQIISILCCKDWEQAHAHEKEHARAKIVHIEKHKKLL